MKEIKEVRVVEMARPRNPSLTTDDRYMIDESEHIDQLTEYALKRLGLLVGESSDPRYWMILAEHLGLDNDKVRRINAISRLDVTVVPGEEVLKVWRQKGRSTILVLRKAFSRMERDDIVRELDVMRLSKSLHIPHWYR